MLFDYAFDYVFSPDMPESEATFAISTGGIIDAKEWSPDSIVHCVTHISKKKHSSTPLALVLLFHKAYKSFVELSH